MYYITILLPPKSAKKYPSISTQGDSIVGLRSQITLYTIACNCFSTVSHNENNKSYYCDSVLWRRGSDWNATFITKERQTTNLNLWKGKSKKIKN